MSSLSAPIEALGVPPLGGRPLARTAGRVSFSLATSADDPDIRHFIAGQSMGHSVKIAVQTEPSFHAAVRLLGHDAEILLARERSSGRIVGLGVRAHRQVLLNGCTRHIGHLFFLRVAPEFRGRRDFLRAGYGYLRDLQDARPVEFCTTAILAENYAARRLLEAGLPGLPVYRSIAGISTITLVVPRCSADASAASPPDVLQEFLRMQLQPMPLSPPLTTLADSPPSLTLNDFVTVQNHGRVLAAAALWDQRSVRQTILTHYAAPLRHLRPFYNILQVIRRRRGLPAPGPLNMAYISHLAVENSDPRVFAQLLGTLRASAAARGIDYLVLSLAADHPLAPLAARNALHSTRSLLYSVTWPGEALPDIPATPYVEAALL